MDISIIAPYWSVQHFSYETFTKLSHSNFFFSQNIIFYIQTMISLKGRVQRYWEIYSNILEWLRYRFYPKYPVISPEKTRYCAYILRVKITYLKKKHVRKGVRQKKLNFLADISAIRGGGSTTLQACVKKTQLFSGHIRYQGGGHPPAKKSFFRQNVKHIHCSVI